MTPLLLRALRQPASLALLGLADWDLLLCQARQGNLMAHLACLVDAQGLPVPVPVRRHLEWARIVAQRHTQAVKWEVLQIQRALAGVGVPLILLKGAAYVMAGLPAAQGRLFSDIDILVPKSQLNGVEAALMLHGWAGTHHDAYDQRYYRSWMHELPPMQHIRRMTVIDVHHAILPETASLHPDPGKLRAAAQPIAGNLMVLAPIDMLLHSATHLFHDGELEHGLRDLLDIDSLLRGFSRQASFWPELLARAAELELSRPLFYALRYAARILHSPIPADALDAAGRPPRPTLELLDALFLRALMPAHPSCSDCLTGLARRLLYVRANWLRMPPLLLSRHLLHKTFMSPSVE